jgi:hypothetical protein
VQQGRQHLDFLLVAFGQLFDLFLSVICNLKALKPLNQPP